MKVEGQINAKYPSHILLQYKSYIQQKMVFVDKVPINLVNLCNSPLENYPF